MFHPFISKLPQFESRFSKRLTPQPKEIELKKEEEEGQDLHKIMSTMWKKIPIVCTLPMTKAQDI